MENGFWHVPNVFKGAIKINIAEMPRHKYHKNVCSHRKLVNAMKNHKGLKEYSQSPRH